MDRRKRGLIVVAVIMTAIGLLACRNTNTHSNDPAPGVAPISGSTFKTYPSEAEPVPEFTEPESMAYTPQPRDFTVTAVTLKKQCFGEAGCSVTYRIKPQYTGLALTDGQAFTVTYIVKGGDTPTEGSFTIQGNTINSDKQDLIVTPRSSSRLVITVTSVLVDQ